MKKTTALDIIRKIMMEIECPLPKKNIILGDLQMMKFKMRPIAGDIATLKKMNSDVLSLLWRIGKVDQIVQSSIHELEEENQEQLIKYLKNLELITQHKIKNALKQSVGSNKKLLKIEVYRENILDDEYIN